MSARACPSPSRCHVHLGMPSPTGTPLSQHLHPSRRLASPIPLSHVHAAHTFSFTLTWARSRTLADPTTRLAHEHARTHACLSPLVPSPHPQPPRCRTSMPFTPSRSPDNGHCLAHPCRSCHPTGTRACTHACTSPSCHLACPYLRA